MTPTPSATSDAGRWPKLAVAGLLGLLAALLFPALGRMPFERAEIYFVDAARGMLERGDWLVPHYRGEPFFDKPVLTYWLIAVAFSVLGFDAGAARVVPAVAALVGLLATLALGRLLVGARAALAGGLILATSAAFVGFGRVAMSDMLLAAFSTAAVAVAVAARQRPHESALLPALGLLLGLGFLTKGPIALLLPGCALALLVWEQRGQPWPWRPGRWLLPAALFALAGCGWWLALWAERGSQPLQYFFLRENLERFAGGTYDSGREPWFYFTTYAVQGAPWSLLLPWALWRAWHAQPGDPAAAGVRFLARWLLLALVPLSLSRGKIDYYLLPLYPAASLAVGWLFAGVPWGARERLWARLALLTTAAGLALGALLLLRLPAAWLPAPQMLTAVRLTGPLVLAGLAWTAWSPRAGRTLVALAAAVASAFLVLTSVFLPAFRGAQPNDAILADVSRELRYRPEARFVLCDDPVRAQRDILFAQRLATDERCDLWAAVSARQPYLLLLDEAEWSLGQAPGMRHVATYQYVPATVLHARTLWSGVRPGRAALYANFATQDPVALLKARREWRRYAQELERAERRRLLGPRRKPQAAVP